MRVDEPGECSPERVPEPEHSDGRDNQLSEPEERVEVSAITGADVFVTAVNLRRSRVRSGSKLHQRQ